MAKRDTPAVGKALGKAAKSPKSSKTPDLFADAGESRRGTARRATGASARTSGEAGYTAKHIEVWGGLEPVRRRPGMYIGGTDEKALHHLFAEVIDNAMDEALAGHADWIDVEMEADGFISVTDNGRGIPVDPHPKFKNKSALEVIMSTLHAGGKLDSEVYEASGGVEIRWSCAKELLRGIEDVPEKATFHFEDGLKDYLATTLSSATLVHPDIFSGSAGKMGTHAAAQWAVAWTADAD